MIATKEKLDENNFTIEEFKEHYVVKYNDIFYCSADTYSEALNDIKEATEE